MYKKSMLKPALLSASLLVASAPAINANIPAMITAFPKIPLQMVEMLTTVPSMFLMISVLTSSFIAKKIGYKQTIVLGLSIVAIFGVIPIFTNQFYIILISRALLGFGIGLFNSLLASIINYFYDGEEKSSLFGIQSACEGLGGMTITFMAGQLLKISWQAPFYAYLITIPIIILFISFVPKIKTEDILLKTNNKTQAKNENKKNNILPLISYILLLFIVAILYMTMGIKIATLMTSEGYAKASDASIVIILLSLGAMISGFLFGKIIKLLKEFTIPVAFLIMATAMYLISISNSTIVTVFAGFLVGFGFRMILPYFINKINTSNLSNPSLATSLLLIGYNLGVFITPYGSKVLEYLAAEQGIRGVFHVNSISFLLLSLGGISVILIKKYISNKITN